MKKNLKKSEIALVYNILNKAHYGKMGNAERIQIIKAMYPMKKVADELSDFSTEAAKRLRPDNYDQIAAKVNEYVAMSPEEQKSAFLQKEYNDALRKNLEFNNALNQCLAEENGKNVELDFEAVTEEAVAALCDSNSEWTLGDCITVNNALCGD